MRGDLSDEEVARHLPAFADKVDHYAKVWFKRYRGKIAFDEIIQAGHIGAWRALLTYRHEAAMPMDVWVTHGTFARIRAFCGEERRKKRRDRLISWPDSDGEPLALPAPIEDQSVLDQRATGAELLKLVGAELNPHDRELLRLRFVDQLTIRELERHYCITFEGVRQKIRRLIGRMRRVVGQHPEFRHWDDQGLLPAPPRTRFVKDGERWVEAA